MENKTTVKNLKNLKKTWRDDDQFVFVGQPTVFGNPVTPNKECPVCGKRHRDEKTTIPCFEEYFFRKIDEDPQFAKEVEGLKGKTLVCLCHPNPCHAHVIAKHVDGSFYALEYALDDCGVRHQPQQALRI